MDFSTTMKKDVAVWSTTGVGVSHCSVKSTHVSIDANTTYSTVHLHALPAESDDNETSSQGERGSLQPQLPQTTTRLLCASLKPGATAAHYGEEDDDHCSSSVYE
jgi:hypothetical protein